jgi:hypothetical protein
MEYDRFEEFGEFETEVEKGGEVKVEELCATFELMPELNLRLGHFFLPLGSAYRLDEPTDYLTVERSETERGLIPVLWDETGVEVSGLLGDLRYRLQWVNGLDNSGFSSGNWVALGHQGKFETVNAEDLAWVGRLDWEPCVGCQLGMAGYYGNSTGNRPKADMSEDAHVGIAQAHGEGVRGPWVARGLFLYGRLENADRVSRANRNLSNNLNAKRTPVAKAAAGWFAELGLDLLKARRMGLSPLNGREHGRGQSLKVYGRYDYYDSMRQTDDGYFNNPRWERRTWSGGFAYEPDPHIVLKGQYAHRKLGLETGNREDTYSLGMGLVF